MDCRQSGSVARLKVEVEKKKFKKAAFPLRKHQLISFLVSEIEFN